MMRILLIVLALVVGCKKDEQPKDQQQQPANSPQKAVVPLRYTVIDQYLARSSRNRESVMATVSMKSLDEFKAWEKESPANEERTVFDQCYGEGDYQKLVKEGHVEIIWRVGNKPRYTVRSSRWSRTSSDEKSVLSTVAMSEEQVRAWVADESAASEERSATFARVGYNEGVSRGKLLIPPFNW